MHGPLVGVQWVPSKAEMVAAKMQNSGHGRLAIWLDQGHGARDVAAWNRRLSPFVTCYGVDSRTSPNRRHPLFFRAENKNALALQLLADSKALALNGFRGWQGVFFLQSEENPLKPLLDPPRELNSMYGAAWNQQWAYALSVLLSFGSEVTLEQMKRPLLQPRGPSESDLFLWSSLAKCKRAWKLKGDCFLQTLVALSSCSGPWRRRS